MLRQPSVPIDIDKRHPQLTAQAAIRDVFDALVEFITNADDSYCEQGEEDGLILIEVDERRGQPSRLTVRDRAQGMNDREMREQLAQAGRRTSGEGTRGFMGRGAKDCAVLGPVEFESIKDGCLYKCEILRTWDYVPYGPPRRCTTEDRARLSIPRGNGMVVTLTLDSETPSKRRLPRIATLERDLPWHYALREIMGAGGRARVLLRNLGQTDTRPAKLRWQPPEGATLEADELYDVADYPAAQARLQIWRVPDPLEDPPDKRFRHSGIWIKGRRAVHECSLLAPELEQDLYAHRYFGRIECAYIDVLCDEYDRRRELGSPHPVTNPSLLIDRDRREQLQREHPFARALLEHPLTRLRGLIAQDKLEDQARRTQVLNDHNRRRLRQLGKAADEFVREQSEDPSGRTLQTTESLDQALAKRGVMLIPSCCTLVQGESHHFYFYARRISGKTSGYAVRVSVDDVSALRLSTSGLILQESPRSENMMYGSFEVKALRPTRAAAVRVSGDGFDTQEAVVEIVAVHPTPQIEQGFAFELKEYQVRVGGTRTLTLLASYPGKITEQTAARVSTSSDSIHIVGRPICLLIPVAGAQFAQGTIRVKAKRLRARATVLAELPGGSEAECIVRAVHRPEKGPGIDIDVRDEAYGNFRARWDRPERPNLLLVSARHESVRRYLGPAGEAGVFPGQDAPYFRLLLAEIVSENICRRCMEEAARARPWEFQNMDVDSFYAYHNKLMKDFTPRAHRIMLADSEVAALGLDGRE